MALRLLLKLEWEEAKEDYRTAGEPFGEKGLDLWVEYGQLTTVN